MTGLGTPEMLTKTDLSAARIEQTGALPETLQTSFNDQQGE